MVDKTQRLIYRLEAENGKLIRKLAESEERFRRTDSVISGSVAHINSRLNQASAGATSFGRAANDSSRGTNRMRGAVGQLGYQVQDIAVQLQSGQNAMLIFGQQGSQIASVFGPGGAVIGAIIAVGAALGTALIPRLFDAKAGTKELSAALDSISKRYTMNSDGVLVLTDRIRNLSKVSKEAAEVELGIALIQSEIAIKKATGEITKSIDDLAGSFVRAEKNIERRTGGRSAIGMAKGTFRAMREELGLTVEQARRFADVSRDALQNPTVDNINAFYDLAKSLDLNNEKLQGFYTTIGTNLDVINQTKEGIEQLKGVMSDVPAALSTQVSGSEILESREQMSRDAFSSLQKSLTNERELIEADYAERQLIIDNALRFGNASIEAANDASYRSWKQYHDSITQLEVSRLNDLSGFFGQTAQIMRDGFGEQNALTKAAFAVQKLLAIPQMIVSTELASTKALELGPIAGPIASAIIKGLGYSSIGIVAGQTLASFEGGGFTGSGPRVGGMDGKGGMLAMLHPNEIVTDMTKGGGGVNIQIVNNVSNAIPRAEMDRDGVIKIMIDELGSQSSRTRSVMHQTSNLAPRGTR